MKYLILITVLFLFSCTEPTRENSVTNPLETTTIYLQSLPKDTIVVSYEDVEENPYIYVWNNNLITEIHTISNSDTVDSFSKGSIILFIFMAFIVGIVLGHALEN